MVIYVPIIAWTAAVLAAAIAVARGQRPLTVPFVADRLVRAVMVFPLGLMSLWAAFGHIFVPEFAARAISWQTSPFQFEVGVANLGIGMSALYSAFRSHDASSRPAWSRWDFSAARGSVMSATSSKPEISPPEMPVRFCSPTF